MAEPFFGGQVDIGVCDAITEDRRRDALITDHLAELLGRERVVIAFGGGSGPYRKPVLQVFGTDGRPLGFVKVGWNEWTKAAVRTEAAALQARPVPTGPIGLPELLHHGRWRDLELVVTAPLPRGVRRPPPIVPDAQVLRAICELSQLSNSGLAESAWWSCLRARVARIEAKDSGRALGVIADRIASQHGRTRLQFGRWHGDLVPWNMARLGARVFAWDWECSAPSAPVGFDALHFAFQVAFVGEGRQLDVAAARALGDARPALADLGVPADNHQLLAKLHVLELAVRHEEARSSTGDADDRFFPPVLDLLGVPAHRYRENPAGFATGQTS